MQVPVQEQTQDQGGTPSDPPTGTGHRTDRPPAGRRPGRRRAAVAAVALVAALGLAAGACGDDPSTAGTGTSTSTTVAPLGGGYDVTVPASTPPTPGEGEVARLELADALPANAPGQHLWLQEVVLGPHTSLAKHYHDGIQIASIREGVLTYHVLSGSVEVRRADGTAETLTAPVVDALGVGDSVVEPHDAVHYGENATDGIVVITLAALVDAAGPVATPVDGS